MRKIFFHSSKPRFINKDEIVKAIKKEAVKAARLDKRIDSVYLFGSYGQGEPSIHSDADLLVVVKDDKRRIIDRIDEYLLKFSDCPVPVDVLVYTKDEIRRAIARGNSFVRNASCALKLA